MQTPDDDSPPRLRARPLVVIGVVACVALVKAWVSASAGLSYDEAYYTLWSLWPSAGYLDHPPAVAWLIALGRFAGGDNELAIRSGAILADVAVAAALYRLGVLLFDRLVAARAVIWHTLTVAAALGFIVTPDATLVLFWTLTLWAIAEFVVSRKGLWWLAAGVFAGLAILSKLTALWLGPGILLFLLISRERRAWLGRWHIWLGGACALATASPMLLWNARHDWETFRFQAGRLADGSPSVAAFAAHASEWAVGQLLAVGPSLVVFAVAAVALRRVATAGGRHGLALVWATALPAIAYFAVHATHARVEANWLLPVWPALTLAAAFAAGRIPRDGWRGRFGGLLRALQVPVQTVLIAALFIQILFYPVRGLDLDRSREFHGWRQLYEEISSVAHDRGARWIIDIGDYGIHGELAAYARLTGDDLTVFQADQRVRYRFDPRPGPDLPDWPALYVTRGGTAPAGLASLFGRIEPLGVVQRKRGGDEVLADFSLFLVDAPSEAFRAIR